MAEHSISFEFPPTRNEERIRNLVNAAHALGIFKSDFFSATFNADSGTTKLTFDTARSLPPVGDVGVAPHMSSRLLEAGTPSLHIYTLNKIHSIFRICGNLGLKG